MSEGGTSGGSPDRATLLARLAEHVSAMLAYWDTDQRCRFANRAYERWFGVTPEALLGRTMKDLLGPIYPLNLPYIEGALRGEPQSFEREIPDPAGGPSRHSLAQYVPDVVDGKVAGFFVLVTDITAGKRAEEAFRRSAAERLMAMSSLAAGIAHEINNPLAAILGNLDLADRALADTAADAPARARVDEARRAALRVAEIVESMKLLSTNDTGAAEPVDVARVLRDSIRVTANATKYRAHLVEEIDDVGLVTGRPTQLSRAFVSLILNAADAVASKPPSEATITVRAKRVDDRVRVEIRDTGSGIAKANHARIFEPFFTTKPVGQGIGLGLATAASIVRGCGGRIDFETEPGRGTTFRVELQGRSASTEAPASAPAPNQRKAKYRVLVVDDDVQVATVIARLLAQRFDVDTMHDARAAIQRLCESPQSYDAILCDVSMPEHDGPEVYETVVEAKPELARRFGFVTGGAFTARTRDFLRDTPVPTLTKPFTADELATFVLARAESSTSAR